MKKIFRELDLRQKLKDLSDPNHTMDERRRILNSLKRTKPTPEWTPVVKTKLILIEAKLDIIEGAQGVKRASQTQDIENNISDNIKNLEEQIQIAVKELYKVYDIDWDEDTPKKNVH